ncbi:MAG: Sec-independent protein translocase protein TatB [Burkholderiales bacterium]
MFDIGFSELMVIAVVALVVIGPERLPRVARTAGHLMGRLQRYVNDVKADINREMETEELRKFKDEFEKTAQSVQTQVNDEIYKSEDFFKSISAEVNPHPEPAKPEQSPETGPGLESSPVASASQSLGAAPIASPAPQAALQTPVAEQKSAA